MSNETITLVNNLSFLGDFTSDKFQGPGYHKQSDNLITFTLSFAHWTGEVILQGTLELYPNNNTDWVNLKDLSDQDIIIGDSSTDYDSTITVNSRGNFVWLRAIGTSSSGTISEIRYNY